MITRTIRSLPDGRILVVRMQYAMTGTGADFNLAKVRLESAERWLDWNIQQYDEAEHGPFAENLTVWCDLVRNEYDGRLTADFVLL